MNISIIFKRSLFLFCLPGLFACVASNNINNNARVYGPEKRFSVDLPKGWIHDSNDHNAVTATRDGKGIQFIRFGFWSHNKSLKGVKKKPRADMLASELAELVIAMIRTNPYSKNARIIENKPMNLAGRQGFKIKVAFKNDKGLRFRRDVYGFAVREGVYFMMYQAPALYFYKKYQPNFYKTVQSFQLGSNQK